MEEKDNINIEEAVSNGNDKNENIDGISDKSSSNAKTASKKNTVYIIAACVACVLLLCLVFININKTKTYNLSSIYPTYFSESENDGEIKLPKDWAYTEAGQLYKNSKGKLTLMGQFLGAELSEDDFNATVESLSAYYELNQISKGDINGYSIHTEDNGEMFDIFILFKDSTYVQIGLMDADQEDIDIIINSLKF